MDPSTSDVSGMSHVTHVKNPSSRKKYQRRKKAQKPKVISVTPSPSTTPIVFGSAKKDDQNKSHSEEQSSKLIQSFNLKGLFTPESNQSTASISTLNDLNVSGIPTIHETYQYKTELSNTGRTTNTAVKTV